MRIHILNYLYHLFLKEKHKHDRVHCISKILCGSAVETIAIIPELLSTLDFLS